MNTDLEYKIPFFDTKELIGKKFRYNGNYGLSNWIDTVHHLYDFNECIFIKE